MADPDEHDNLLSNHTTTKLTTQSLLEPGQILAERFRIVRLLGHGGQARVFEAYDEVLETPCALKVLAQEADASEIEHLRNEVLLARQIHHANVVRIHEFYATPQATFFTMALVNGKVLSQALDDSPSASDVIKWFEQLLGALQSCHESGVIHGDLKPDNLLIDDDGNLSIIDFGIGRTLDDSSSQFGSTGFVAPELAKSQQVTTASDRYALGKTLALILEASESSSWKSASVTKRALQKLAVKLQADTPNQRPSLAQCQDLLNSTASTGRKWLALAAVVVFTLSILIFMVPQEHTELPPEASVTTIAIAMIDGEPALAELTHLLLQAEPNIYSIEPQNVSQLIKNMGIQPFESASERARLAQLTQAQYLLILTPRNLSGKLQLHALLTAHPSEQVIFSKTFDTENVAPESLVTAISAALNNALPNPNTEIDSTAFINYKVVQDLAVARADGDVNSLMLKLREVIDSPKVPAVLKVQARIELAIINEQFEPAAALLDELLKQFPHRADILAQRANVAAALNDLTGAREYYRRALSYDRNQPMWWFELARLKIIQGETESAINEELTQSLIQFRQREDVSGQGLILNAFGVAYLRLAKFDTAAQYFQQALEYRTQERDPRQRITTLSNLATVLAITGQIQEADQSLREATRLADEINDALAVAHIENERGLLFEEQGDYQSALRHYKRALDIRLREGDEYVQSQSINNVAFINFLIGDFSLAEVYWRQALQTVENLNEQATLHSIQLNLVQLLIAQGQFNQAEQLLAELLGSEDKSTEANLSTQLQISRLNFLQGRMAVADDAGEQAEQIAQSINDPRGAIESLLWRAEMAIFLHQTDLFEQHSINLRALQNEFNQEQKLIFDWLLLLSQKDKSQADLAAFAERVIQQQPSRLVEIKLLSELVFRGDFPKSAAVWQRLETISNERVFASYLPYLAARSFDNSKQLLQAALQQYPSFWRNFELYSYLNDVAFEEQQRAAYERLIENMNEKQQSAYKAFASSR
ncbi:protein kinase domain-containing protein [Pseudidiomarina sp.]|uniref:serine/threonine-protein kinase n=1 Tax=Pseudidiomarina sp. TaxID=2081707 RepID=UPI003A96B86A